MQSAVYPARVAQFTTHRHTANLVSIYPGVRSGNLPGGLLDLTCHKCIN